MNEIMEKNGKNFKYKICQNLTIKYDIDLRGQDDFFFEGRDSSSSLKC